MPPTNECAAEIGVLKNIFEKRIRAAIANKWGTVTMIVNVQNGKISSIRDADEQVWQLKKNS